MQKLIFYLESTTINLPENLIAGFPALEKRKNMELGWGATVRHNEN